jgi:hypothetical protein
MWDIDLHMAPQFNLTRVPTELWSAGAPVTVQLGCRELLLIILLMPRSCLFTEVEIFIAMRNFELIMEVLSWYPLIACSSSALRICTCLRCTWFVVFFALFIVFYNA